MEPLLFISKPGSILIFTIVMGILFKDELSVAYKFVAYVAQRTYQLRAEKKTHLTDEEEFHQLINELEK